MNDIPAKDTIRSTDVEAPTQKPLRIVGIGAGAGGLEAIQLLFGAMPLDANLAFVVCRRVRPGLADPLADLLRTQTAMPVTKAENGTVLQAGRIHLVAPDARMILLKDRLVALEADLVDQTAPAVSPIDLLLHSLAASAGPAAIALMLSGNDRDGLRGCASIREYGGLVLVQHPESTEFTEMPRRVIEADLASAVAPPGAMPDLIRRHIGKTRVPEAGQNEGDGDEEALTRITALLAARFAIDAHAYRPSLVAKRVRRRLGMSEAETLGAYADLLTKDDAELAALHDDLLIRVTTFFRDPEAFAVLKREVAPVLVERMAPERPIRIWVPACASGEEAYSLAMLILGQTERAGKKPHLEILASDRHAAALKRARFGRYRRDRLANAPAELVERYMQSDGERVETGPLLRRHVTFVDHDILQAPPPDDIDLVSCRNLLIYLAAGSREKALQACCEALKPDGFLFLGPSEQPGPLMTGLATVHGKWRIYRKAGGPPVDDALTRLAAGQRRKPAEAIFPPAADMSETIGKFEALDLPTPDGERSSD
ncbi:MAG: CheR family methyltransferase, partial [Geminicoccaceae bacterium]